MGRAKQAVIQKVVEQEIVEQAPASTNRNNALVEMASPPAQPSIENSDLDDCDYDFQITRYFRLRGHGLNGLIALLIFATMIVLVGSPLMKSATGMIATLFKGIF